MNNHNHNNDNVFVVCERARSRGARMRRPWRVQGPSASVLLSTHLSTNPHSHYIHKDGNYESTEGADVMDKRTIARGAVGLWFRL